MLHDMSKFWTLGWVSSMLTTHSYECLASLGPYPNKNKVRIARLLFFLQKNIEPITLVHGWISLDKLPTGKQMKAVWFPKVLTSPNSQQNSPKHGHREPLTHAWAHKLQRSQVPLEILGRRAPSTGTGNLSRLGTEAPKVPCSVGNQPRKNRKPQIQRIQHCVNEKEPRGCRVKNLSVAVSLWFQVSSKWMVQKVRPPPKYQ